MIARNLAAHLRLALGCAFIGYFIGRAARTFDASVSDGLAIAIASALALWVVIANSDGGVK